MSSESSDEMVVGEECLSGRRTTARQLSMHAKKIKPVNVYTKTWSEFEKQMLLTLLSEHGDSDISKLAAGLPKKHPIQVKTYLRTISRRALQVDKNRKRKEQLKRLDDWIELLNEAYGDEIEDDSLPFKLYTMSRKFAKPNTEFSNEIVDFQKAYEYLYSLTIGRKIDVDERTYYFVHSYLDWFLSEFDKFISSSETGILLSALRKISLESPNKLTPKELIPLLLERDIPQEEAVNNRHLLRTACKKVRRTMFKKGEEYDRRVSLLKAETDPDPAYANDAEFCALIPFMDDVKFTNLVSFVWAALFNIPVKEFQQISNET